MCSAEIISPRHGGPAGTRAARVVLAGDSTVAPYVATAYPMCGWGAHLGAALTARCEAGPIHVVDLAKNGASTASHREDGLWAAVLDASHRGDVVVLQFGHNDPKRPELDPWGGYSAALRTMVDEIREAGATPVLCTPVARRHFEGEHLLHTHGDYPAALLSLAEHLEVSALDLHARTRELLIAMGPQRSRRLFTQLSPGTSALYPEGLQDDTHFSVDGAVIVAEIVAELLSPIVSEAVAAAHLTPPRQHDPGARRCR